MKHDYAPFITNVSLERLPPSHSHPSSISHIDNGEKVDASAELDCHNETNGVDDLLHGVVAVERVLIRDIKM